MNNEINSKEIIFVAGLGYTGSSALIDLIKEVDSYFVFENEFRLLVDPKGIVNLRDALTRNWSIFQTDMALREYVLFVKNISSRFRSPYASLDHSRYFDSFLIEETIKFIEELTEISFRGFWYGIDNIIIRKLKKFNFFHKKKITTKLMRVGKIFSESDFDKIAGKYLNHLFNFLLNKYEKKSICINENFSCMFPKRIFKIVNNSKIILVVRDPRDVYSSGLKSNAVFAPKNPEDFIRWEFSIYSRWLKIFKLLKENSTFSHRIKVIKFEDLILNYNDTIKHIFNFCNIRQSEHKQKNKYLKITESSKNVGLWKQTLSAQVACNIEKKFAEFYSCFHYKI